MRTPSTGRRWGTSAAVVTVLLAMLAAPGTAIAATGSISGTVTAASGGAPIAEISVCVFDFDSGEFVDCAEPTAGDGTYTVNDLAEGTYRVNFFDNVASRNFALQYYDETPNGTTQQAEAQPVSVTEGIDTPEINAELVKGGAIEGTVKDAATGAPIEGFEVCANFASSGEWANCGRSEEGGEYTIPGLPADTYAVEFSGQLCDEGYECSRSDYVRRSDEATVVTEQTTDLGVTLMEAGGSLSGTVRAASGGAPLPEISVCAFDFDSGELVDCAEPTGGDGTYTIHGLPESSYRVNFWDFEGTYANQFYKGVTSWNDATPVPVAVGVPKTGIDANMQLAGSISGEVTAEGGPQLAAIEVCAFDANTFEFAECAEPTDAEGKYEIRGLPAGEYKVQFWDPEGEYASQYYNGATSWNGAVVVTVTAGSLSPEVDAVMQLAGWITGTVTNHPSGAPGEPIAGLQVCAAASKTDGEQGEFVECVETDDSGNYSLALAAGEYAVGFFPISCAEGCRSLNYLFQVYREGPWQAESEWADATMVTVSASTETPGIDAELQEAGRITGNVTDRQTGEPVAGIEVCAYESAGHFEGEEFVGYWQCADPGSGSEYDIVGLPADEYKVRFFDASGNYATQYYDETTSGAGEWSEAAPIPVGVEQTAAGKNATLVAAPANTAAPSVAGAPAVGSTLTCSPGSWTYSPSYSYAWLRDGNPIGGQTASSHVVQGADEGHGIACRVTATNAAGEASATSNTLQIPVPTPTPAPAPAPSQPAPVTEAPQAGGSAAATAGAVLVKGGKALVSLACRGVAACKGVAKLVVRIKAPPKRSRQAARRSARRTGRRTRNLVIGKSRFSIAAGRKATVRIRLTGKGKKLLRKAGKRGLKATLTGSGIKRRVVKLREPARSGRRGARRLGQGPGA